MYSATVERAGIYARISEDRSGEALGVARQLKDCREFCAARGLAIAGEYVDNDVSASGLRRRPEYERLLEDVNGGHLDVIVAWHADRIYRRPRDLEGLIDTVERAGTTIATVKAGEMDLGTASGRMVARMLGAVARHEVELKSERQRRKHRELAEAGKPAGGGDRPFGYEADRVTVNTAEAKCIREATRHVLAGGTLRALVASWNDKGILTPSGGRWRITTLRRMLTSPRIAGLRAHRGEVVADATWRGIISPAQNETLVAILKDPARRTTTTNARTYLLSGGLLRCGDCGAAMVARPNERKARRYACVKEAGGCNRMFCLAEPLEGFVRDAVFTALDGPGLEAIRRAMAEDDADPKTADELPLIHARLDELAASFAAGALSLPAYERATRKLESHRDELQHRVASTARRRVISDLPSNAEALAAWWGSSDLASRRELISAVVKHVEIAHAVKGSNKFDAERVKIVWRV
jgi:DNA invertase Pin-like site-specific DNA recombinase